MDTAERFTALYDACHPRVFAYAVTLAGRDLAEEIAGETFCIAWRRFGDLPDPPLPWLLGIARNEARRNFRAEARQVSLARELRGWAGPIGDVGDQVADRADLLHRLAALSGTDREALTLVAWHGLTAAEAARVVGCSKAAFFVRLHRARQRLAKSDVRPRTRLIPEAT
ncbi:hypothetical protein GCM10027589_27520 [Actinocorallia lasiicapitis]